jgi:hypothetical protein
MQTKNGFTRFAAICCFLSVVTTLGIHLYFPDPPTDFEQRVLLHKNTTYLLNRWWVIIHCLLVLVSMWGFCLVQRRKAPGATGLGFIFFTVFAFAEITRQLFILFYMNELRVQYAAAMDVASKENLRILLTYAGLLTAPLFGLFILSFAIGNLCYGLSLWKENGHSKWVSFLLLFWAAGTFAAFGNSFWRSDKIGSFIDSYNYTFQPLVRALLGVWLWRKSNSLVTERITTNKEFPHVMQALQ